MIKWMKDFRWNNQKKEKNLCVESLSPRIRPMCRVQILSMGQTKYYHRRVAQITALTLIKIQLKSNLLA